MHEHNGSDDEVQYEDIDDLEEGLPEKKVCGISSCAWTEFMPLIYCAGFYHVYNYIGFNFGS